MHDRPTTVEAQLAGLRAELQEARRQIEGLQEREGRSRRQARATFAAGMAALVAGWALVSAQPGEAARRGVRLKAPVTVVDNANRPVLTIGATTTGGALQVLNSTGAPVATLDAVEGVNGRLAVAVGAGAPGKDPESLLACIVTVNAQGQVLSGLGATADGGRVIVRNSAGAAVAQMDAAGGLNGRLAVGIDPDSLPDRGEPCCDIVAVNRLGDVLAGLGATVDGGALTVRNAVGADVARLTTTNQGRGSLAIGSLPPPEEASPCCGIHVFGSGAQPLLELGENAAGGSLTVRKPSGVGVAQLQAGDAGGDLELFNSAGVNIMNLRSEGAGDSRLLLRDRTGAVRFGAP